MHVLHAIHDFLPRHQAGSELYAWRLAKAQSARHHVTILCADFDPAREHGHVEWRVHDGLAVVELVNNWRCATFEDTYRSPLIGERIRHALDTLRPDVVHVHNLLDLSFDLPLIAKRLGIPVVATLHDYTLVCPSGGQRVHQRESHVCVDIDAERCTRCFQESVFFDRMTFGTVANGSTTGRLISKAALRARRFMPGVVDGAARTAKRMGGVSIQPRDIEARFAAAQRVFDQIDMFVAPSATLGREFIRFGLPADRLTISDYGMNPWPVVNGHLPSRPIRIGLIGTVVWHKGAHVFIEALRSLPAGSFTASVFGSLETFGKYSAAVQQSAAGLPIEFRGAFAPDRAADAFHEIDVLVVPSLWPENSPLVIHEAFQARVAVVAARVGGIPDLVSDGVSGLLFDAGSAADLAARLRELIEDPARAQALAAAAPPVKTIQQNADEWDMLYRDLLEESAVCPS